MSLEVREEAVRLSRHRRTLRPIACELGIPTSAARIVKGAGLSRRMLESPEPPNRYVRAFPGDMVHPDIKKLARSHAPGNRVTHTRTNG